LTFLPACSAFRVKTGSPACCHGGLQALVEFLPVGFVVEDIDDSDRGADRPSEDRVEPGMALSRRFRSDKRLGAVGEPHLGFAGNRAGNEPDLVEVFREILLGDNCSTDCFATPTRRLALRMV